jgi:serine/threonine-protein kinase RsbW
LELAVEEIAANIITYAYSPAGSGDLECGFAADGKTAEVSLTDWGAAFNPLEKEDPDLAPELDRREPGGLGIYLARNLAGSCSYRRDGGRNILTISMPLQPEAGSARSKEEGA